MKILQLCHKPPLPAVDGGCIAMNNITQMLLAHGHDVHVLAIFTQKHPASSDNLPEDYVRQTHFQTVFINTSLKPIPALKAFVTGTPYHITRFISKAMEQKLITLLQKERFDIVQLESIFTAPYIPIIQRYSKAKIILRPHNVEHQIWERIVENETFLPRKIMLKRFTASLKKFELSLFQKIDGYMAISSHDYEFFHQHFPRCCGTVIPFGLDLNDYEEDEDYIPSDAPELFHLGSMDWEPNREGIEWFLEEVWEKILHVYPSLTFTVAGRHIPPKMQASSTPGVNFIGDVPDAKQFMLSKDIMIVPLLSGSGIRVKIIEGMALGKTVITTTIGAEGLSVEHGKNIFIADTPEEFIDCVGKCVQSPDLCKIIGENARDFVAINHNNNLIIKQLEKFYYSVL